MTDDVAQRIADGRNEWGRWGPDDQIGRANLLDDAHVLLTATSCIRSGKRFSLALPVCSPGGDPCLPGRMQAVHLMTQDESHYAAGRTEPLAGGMKFADDSILLSCHGTTHLDALGHAYSGDQLYNGYPADTTIGGLRKAGVDALARQGVVGRAVLVDLARHAGVRDLGMSHHITVEAIKESLAAQHTEVRRGDVLLLRTGIFQVFYDDGPEAFYRHFDEPGVTYEPGLIEFLCDNDIVGLGTDTLCNEQAHSAVVEADFPLHVALQRNLGITFHEALWLEEWAADCDDDGIYDGFYVAAPIRVAQGTAGPMNPIVIK
ncbi:MAG: cyclase family protein [Actinomycetota bacterium]|nr:cyclase family protein [Actinomycetota bacterium]